MPVQRVTMLLRGNEKYDGYVDRTGQPSGQGHIIYNNGFSFEGAFEKYLHFATNGTVKDSNNLLLNGYHEHIEYYNAGFYSGDYIAGKRDGFGIFTFDGGDTWEGNSRNDQWDGLFLVTAGEHYGEIRDEQQNENFYVGGDFKWTKIAGAKEIATAQKRRNDAEKRRIVIRHITNLRKHVAVTHQLTVHRESTMVKIKQIINIKNVTEALVTMCCLAFEK